MAIVTFPIELGGNGLVVSDDTDPVTGLRNGGYLTRFVPALQQTVAVAGFVVGLANDAANSEAAASGFATAASGSASSAAGSAASAASSFLTFDNRQLGAKAANPTTDNYGGVLIVGATYFNTTALETRVWNGATWQTASVNGGTVNSLTVTGAFEYQGTFTGGAGVMNIGGGQIFKDASGNVVLGGTANPSGYKFKVSSGGAEISFAVNQKIEFLSTNSGVTGIRLFSRTDAGELSPLELQGSSVVFPLSTGNAGLVFNAVSGNLLLGALTDTGGKLFVVAPDALGRIATFADTGTELVVRSVEGVGISLESSGALIMGAGSAEVTRMTSARFFKASNTGSYQNVSGNFHEFRTDQNSINTLFSSANTGASVVNSYSSLTTAGSAGKHFRADLNATEVFRVLATGTVENATNVYGAISDPKLKDIVGPKSSTWDKTKQYNWIEYYLKSDTEHQFKMLGLNAAEAALVSPGVIDETPDLVEVHKVRDVPTLVPRLDENENPILDEEGNVIYDEVMVQESYTEWEPNGEVTLSAKYSVVSMQYHRTTQECQVRIEDLELSKVQTDDLIQQIMGRVAALESASA